MLRSVSCLPLMQVLSILQEKGITFSTLSPFNEPQPGWWVKGGQQLFEGANYPGGHQDSWLKCAFELQSAQR